MYVLHLSPSTVTIDPELGTIVTFLFFFRSDFTDSPMEVNIQCIHIS